VTGGSFPQSSTREEIKQNRKANEMVIFCAQRRHLHELMLDRATVCVIRNAGAHVVGDRERLGILPRQPGGKNGVELRKSVMNLRRFATVDFCALSTRLGNNLWTKFIVEHLVICTCPLPMTPAGSAFELFLTPKNTLNGSIEPSKDHAC